MILKKKVALVTGASSGIGRSTAILFAKEGAKIGILGRDVEGLHLTDSEIKKVGGQSLVTPADVVSYDDCQSAVSLLVKQYGQLDIVVNAAGIISEGSIENTSLNDWNNMMNVNLNSVFQIMQLTIPHLEKTKGNIVNLSSVTGLRAFPNIIAYCVSKAGVDHLTHCSALELAPKGIRVNAVNPGVIETKLHRRGGMDDKRYSEFLEHSKTTHPIGRIGQPEEVAKVILFLSSESAQFITGETLSVDGGRHLTCLR